MPVDFPAGPVEGQTYAINGITYVFQSGAWVTATSVDPDARYVNVAGDTMTGPLTVRGAPPTFIFDLPGLKITSKSGTSTMTIMVSDPSEVAFGTREYIELGTTLSMGGIGYLETQSSGNLALSIFEPITCFGSVSAIIDPDHLTTKEYVDSMDGALNTSIGSKEPAIVAGTTTQYWRGDKSWQTLDKAAVGLGNVDNTTDLNKPVSTATQTALNLKANLASPTFTGVPAAPTAAGGTNTTQIATTAFVTSAITTAAVPGPATVAPLMAGVAAVGTTTKYAREDHKHPSDTAKLDATHAGTGGAAHANVIAAGAAGFMTGADKTKLDGIATGANLYVHPTGDGNLHVPVTSTTNNGRFLKAGATAGALSWALLATTDISGLDASLAAKEPTIAAGTTAQYWRGDKSWQTLDKAAVGLGNVDNTTDASKPVSTAQAAADALRVLKAGDTMTGNLIIQKGSPNFTLDAVGTTSGAVIWKRDNITLYSFFTSGTPLNLFLWRYDDAGVNNGTIMQVTRLTGEIGLGGSSLAGSQVRIVTPSVNTSEIGLHLHNQNNVNDSEVKLLFTRTNNIALGSITGQREGAANAGSLVFRTANLGVESVALTINSANLSAFSGPVTINSLNSLLSLTGAAGTLRNQNFQTAGVNRFQLRLNNVAEGGSNAGSNLQLMRFQDDGSNPDASTGALSVFEVDRATGQIAFNAGVAAGIRMHVAFQASENVDDGINLLLSNNSNISGNSSGIQFGAALGVVAPRATIRGQRSGNNGDFIIATAVSGVMTDTLTLTGIDRRAMFNTDTIGIATARTPASATAAGVQGQICWDANYVYVCTATNVWKRAALATW
jgi:hypothetical protein